MAIVRGNARLLGGFLAILIMGLMAWWVVNAIPESEATLAFLPPEPVQPLTRVDAARLHELRQDAGLNDDALGILDLSDSQLDAVLTDLRGWYTENSEQLATVRKAVADANSSIRSLTSQINTGQGGENLPAQLATAKATLATAKATYETLLASARTSAVGAEATQQLALLDRMRNQGKIPMPYRALDLNDQQRRDLIAALVAHSQRISLAGNEPVPGIDLSEVLGMQNIQQLASINAVRGPASHRVVNALARNLPVIPDPTPNAAPGLP